MEDLRKQELPPHAPDPRWTKVLNTPSAHTTRRCVRTERRPMVEPREQDFCLNARHSESKPRLHLRETKICKVKQEGRQRER
ncbi:unnamed protein product [Linum trigynum]|uniref:Uncharacterized protein n=1 Tax=Linum trigynum TaxID=586398 RepID=A0AAV2E3G9_9ROSI